MAYLHSVDSSRKVLEHSHASDRGRVPRGGATLSPLPGQGRPATGASANTGHHAVLPSSCMGHTPVCQPHMCLHSWDRAS